MQLRGTQIDEYVIYMGKSVYGGINDWQFLFQIKEEGLNIDFNYELYSFMGNKAMVKK